MSNRTQYIIIAIILAGSGLYLALWGTEPILSRDSTAYLKYAGQVLESGIPPLQWRTPGFPLFLLLTGSYPEPGSVFVIASVLLFGVSVYLQTRILTGIGLKARYVLAYTGIIYVPVFIEYSWFATTENLVMFFMTCTLFSVWKWLNSGRWWYGAIAVATLILEMATRPSNQYHGLFYGLALAAIVWFTPGMRQQWKPLLRKALVLALGPMLYLGAVSTYYYAQTGYFGQTTYTSITWLSRMWRVYERIPDEHKEVRTVLIGARDWQLINEPSHTGYLSLMRSPKNIGRELDLNHYETMHLVEGIGKDLVLRAPLTYLYEAAITAGGFWLPNVTKKAIGGSRGMQFVLSVFQALFAGLFLVSAGWFLYHAGSRASKLYQTGYDSRYTALAGKYSPTIILLGTPVAYIYLLSIAVAAPEARYRDPVEPMMLMVVFVIWAFISEIRAVSKSNHHVVDGA